MKHAVGDVALQTQPLPLAGAERAVLVEDRVGHAESSPVVNETGTPEAQHVFVPQTQPGPRLRREVGDGASVAKEVRRLQVDKVRDRGQRSIEPLVVQDDREPRLGADRLRSSWMPRRLEG